MNPLNIAARLLVADRPGQGDALLHRFNFLFGGDVSLFMG
jgi:hypothetical protein